MNFPAGFTGLGVSIKDRIAWLDGVRGPHKYNFKNNMPLTREYLRGKYHCTVDLLFDWFGISCMTTNNFCFYLQNRLIQTSQTGGQWQ
jgi:hypothetical protein